MEPQETSCRYLIQSKKTIQNKNIIICRELDRHRRDAQRLTLSATVSNRNLSFVTSSLFVMLSSLLLKTLSVPTNSEKTFNASRRNILVPRYCTYTCSGKKMGRQLALFAAVVLMDGPELVIVDMVLLLRLVFLSALGQMQLGKPMTLKVLMPEMGAESIYKKK